MCSITSWSIFPANIDFATDDKGALSCCIHEGLMCLFIVCETTCKIGESCAISHANGTEQQAEQVAANLRWGRFSTETPLEREHRLEIYRQWRRRQQQETVEQREHCLAQGRQRCQHSDHKHVQRQRQNTTITLQTKLMKRGNTDSRCFKKR